MANLVDIVKDIISLINLNIPVTSTDGVRIDLCYTLHITLGKIVTDENGLEYKVTDIENNSWIDVEPYGHLDAFAGTTVIAPTITFLHGSPSSVNSEYLKLDSKTLNKTPFIWLLESYEYDDLGKGSSLEASFNARMFFMDWCDAAEWVNDEHNDLSIKPMTNLANAFLNVVDKSYSFKTVESSSVKVRSRFGVEVTNKGSERKIIDDDFSGVEVNVKLDLYDTEICCSSSDVPNYICYPVTYDITDSTGASLYAGSIVSGGSLSQVITDSNVQNSDGTYNVNLKAQENLVLPTETILVTNTNFDIIAQDVNRPSVKDGVIEVPNITLTDSDGSLLSKEAGIDLVCTPVAPCLDVTVENSDLSYTNTVASGGTLVLPDVTNTDSDGLPVVTPSQTPFVCTPSSPQLYQAAKVMQTGQTVNYGTGDQPNRGRDIDIFILDYTNEWGHSFRFCGLTGGYTDGTSYFDVSGVATTKALAFPDDIIFDFSARDVDSVLSYYIGDSFAYRGYNTAISLYITSVFGGLSNWYLANDIEMRNIMSVAAFNDSNHWMGHKPFEFDSSRRYFITSSRSGINIVAIEMQGMNYAIGTSLTNALLQIYVRYTTLAELGL